MTHHSTTQQEIVDIKGVFKSYYMKKYTLIHFEIQKKLIVVGLFLLLAVRRASGQFYWTFNLSKRFVPGSLVGIKDIDFVGRSEAETP